MSSETPDVKGESRIRTSDARTQETGPKDREKKILVMNITAIPALCAATCGFGIPSTSGGKQATIAVSIEYVTVMIPAPNIKGFLRPTVSRTNVIKLSKGTSLAAVSNLTSKTSHEVCDWSDSTVDTLYKK